MEPKTPLHGTGAEDSAGSEARPVWTLCGLVSLFSCNRNGVDSGKMDSPWSLIIFKIIIIFYFFNFCKNNNNY